jgi:phospholipid transport system substrate-binding protein
MRFPTVLAAWVALAAVQTGFAAPPTAAPQATAPQSGASGATSEQPSQIVQQTAESILKDLEANRAAEYAAKLVLGIHWRNATPDQRKRFVDAFYHSLLTNYGSALTEFTADRLKVYPSNVGAGDDHATVRSDIKRDNGDRVAVNYSLHKTPEGWKAYDVNIEGISYVKSYRDDFGSQIQQQGLDAVIARLERGEKPSDINKTTKTTGSKS